MPEQNDHISGAQLCRAGLSSTSALRAERVRPPVRGNQFRHTTPAMWKIVGPVEAHRTSRDGFRHHIEKAPSCSKTWDRQMERLSQHHTIEMQVTPPR